MQSSLIAESQSRSLFSLYVMNLFDPNFASWMIPENVLLAIAFERGRVIAVRAFPRFNAHVRVFQPHVLIQSLLRRDGLSAIRTLVPSAARAQFAAAATEAAAETRSLQGRQVAQAAEKTAQGSGDAAQCAGAAASADAGRAELMRGRQNVRSAGADQRRVDERIESATA